MRRNGKVYLLLLYRKFVGCKTKPFSPHYAQNNCSSCYHHHQTTRLMSLQRAFRGVWNHRPGMSTIIRQPASRSSYNVAATTNQLMIQALPAQFLRAADVSNFDPYTNQRTDFAFDPDTGKPIVTTRSYEESSTTEMKECSLQDDYFRVVWEDGLVSKYAAQWVEEMVRKREAAYVMKDRELVTGLTEDKLRSSSTMRLAFEDAITADGMDSALHTLYKYGILLITGTPVNDDGAGVAALSSALGGGSVKNHTSLLAQYSKERSSEILLPRGTDGPMRTLWGTVWSTSSSGQAEGASVADSSYGNGGLPLHTDMTYSRDPPGLQIFTMVQPAQAGGESTYCDGFAAADRLRRTNPDAFRVLSSTTRRYRCVDSDTGWHLEASGPVIALENGEIVAIRHNDLDRLPDLPRVWDCTDDDVEKFYKKLKMAHKAWDEILSDDDMRIVISLQPGDTIVVANQRVLHGRFGFDASAETPRSIMGCYMSQEELNSRFRLLGYNC